MKVHYAGQNIYKQFICDPHNVLVETFAEFQYDEEFYLFSSSIFYNTVVTPKKLIIFGYLTNPDVNLYEINIGNISRIVQICCNNEYILLLNERGHIYKIKLNEQPLSYTKLSNFINVDSENNSKGDYIFQIASGSKLNVAVTNNGNIYSIPTRIDIADKLNIKNIKCGIEHTLLLTHDGSVYSWGSGTRGQLGHGNLEDLQTPKLIDALSGIKITKIASGGWHSAAISEHGDLYIWGWNNHCQLGFKNNSIENSVLCLKSNDNNKNDTDIEQNVNVLAMPTVVDFENIDVKVVDVSCGYYHTIVLTDDTTLYGSGWNKYSQLGSSNTSMEHYSKMTVLKNNILEPSIEICLHAGPFSSALLFNKK